MNKTTIAGAVAITTLGVVLVLGTQVIGVNDAVIPLVTTVLGFIGLLVSQMMSGNRTESTAKKVTELNADLRNGTFERLLREAIVKVASDEATKLHISHTNEKEGEDA